MRTANGSNRPQGIHSFGKVIVWLLPGVFFALLPQFSGAADAIQVLPREFQLSGAGARQRLLVEHWNGQEMGGQVAGTVQWTTSDPKVVRLEGDFALPVGNGTADVTARVGNLSASARVTVTTMEQPLNWSFRTHVQSVLAKANCSSGACHGALAGKKGFRLSLRGFDAEGDYNVLTRQARGRRVDIHDPGRSLLLLKPSMAIPHGGGLRLEPDSLDYKLVADWIASGAPAPRPNDRRIERLEILPSAMVVKPNTDQQLIVRAYFNDGHSEDVTRWAKYSATNAEVAKVDDDGKARILGHGEGAITAWCLNRIAVATITVPYTNPIAPEVFTSTPRGNLIDELVLEKLARLRVPPAPPCDDSDFLRRAYLDTLGIIPTAAEARAFLLDNNPDKRDRLIDELLNRPEFVDYWSYKWSDLFLVNSANLRPPAMWAYYQWIRDQVAANTPWDVLARRVVTAQGSTLENGATNFFVLHQDPLELTETISQAFLGMSINCARCHNHPLEKWTNDQYFGMANLVARVRVKDAAGDGHFTVFNAPSGEIIQPLTGRAQPPQPLDGPVVREEERDRRDHLANWLTAPENPYFTRAIVNRVWSNFMGVGLVETVDDLRLTNPPSNPALLAALTRYLSDNRYDLKALMRLILQSRSYQRSSSPLAGNKDDRRFYSRYYLKRLKAEVMLDAISQVLEAPTTFPTYPPKWRALQLPDSNVASIFLRKFGRPDRQITCECERTSEPSMPAVLHLYNGDTMHEKLRSTSNRISRLMAANTPVENIVEELFLAALARFPTTAEKEQYQRVFQSEGKGEQRRLLMEDLFWSVLSSKEFMFNH